MIGIYKITNKLNGKSYIGQSIHCGKRLDEHYAGSKQFIDETIGVEGIENFTFEILEICSKEELDEKENYYINKYNTLYPNGYNKIYNNCKNKDINKNGKKQLQENILQKEPTFKEYNIIYDVPDLLDLI